MRILMMVFSVVALGAVPIVAAETLYKCVDGRGKVSYSDKACQREPRPPAVLKAGQQGVNKAISGRLTEVLVTKVLLHASNLGMQSDYQGQCALAAMDIVFKITDDTVSPARVYSGGRAQICALQRDSATTIENAGLKAAIKHGPHRISLNADNTKATAKYRTTTTLSMQGQRVMTTECDREETLGVYGDVVLYSDVVATCRTSGG